MTKSGIEQLATVEEIHIAQKHGFKCLAGPYFPGEMEELARVVVDAKKLNRTICLVQPNFTEDAHEVWQLEWTSDEEFKKLAIQEGWKVRN